MAIKTDVRGIEYDDAIARIATTDDLETAIVFQVLNESKTDWDCQKTDDEYKDWLESNE